MTQEELKSLHEGDIIINHRGDTYVVLGQAYTAKGEFIPIAVRQVQVTDQNEWHSVRKHEWLPVVAKNHLGRCHISCGHTFGYMHAENTPAVVHTVREDPRVIVYAVVDDSGMILEITYATDRTVDEYYRNAAELMGLKELS